MANKQLASELILNDRNEKGDQPGQSPSSDHVGEMMAEQDKQQTVTLEELMVSTLAMTDAVVKLVIEKGVIADHEFKKKLSEERANYLVMLKRLH